MARVQATVIGKALSHAKVGDTVTLNGRDADILRRLGRVQLGAGTYARRDMVAQPPGETAVVIDNRRVDVSALQKVELRELANSMGLKVHHAAGEEKLRQAIREAQKPQR